MKNNSNATLLIILITGLILSACQLRPDVNQTSVQSPMEQPVSSDNTPDAMLPVNSDESEQRVYIDTIQTNIMESFPLQVSVTINGNLPDGCTSIINSKTNFDSNKNTFTIQIFTERPKDLMCTQALVPFTETIPLDVYGLPAGIYTVNVYQLSTTFKFDFDNKISE